MYHFSSLWRVLSSLTFRMNPLLTPSPRRSTSAHVTSNFTNDGGCPGWICDRRKNLIYKKVLLRERKRHTARRVARTRYTALSGGYLIQTWLGVPWLPPPSIIQTWLGVTPSRPGWGVPQVPPPPDLVGGYPIQTWLGGSPGTPPGLVGGYSIQTWSGGTPSRPGWGYSVYPPPSRPGMGYPPPNLRWGTPHT